VRLVPVLGLGLVVAMMIPILNFYQFVRVGDAAIMEKAKSDPFGFVAERVKEYATITEDEQETLKEEHDKNIATRGFVLLFFSRYLKHVDERSLAPLGGFGLTQSALNALPRQLYPQKRSLLLAEALYLEKTGFYVGDDEADSFYLDSFVDFGWFGPAVYGFVYCLMLVAVFWVARIMGRPLPLIAVFAIATEFAARSAPEGATWGYFAFFRNTLLLLVAVLVIDRVCSKENG
jgi:hypothetical protein